MEGNGRLQGAWASSPDVCRIVLEVAIQEMGLIALQWTLAAKTGSSLLSGSYMTSSPSDSDGKPERMTLVHERT